MNNTGGGATQKGINAQNWAAMSLFLQYVTRPNFSYIGFEGEKLEDFHLVFKDGKKTICESKARDINLADIRNILDKITKHAQISKQDEILIVCKSVNKNAKDLIENYKYFTKNIEKKLKNKKHKFEDKHLKLISQLKFWEVKSRKRTEKATKVLMARVLNYPSPFWINQRRLNQITDSFVLQKVYFGSEKGDILTRNDFLKSLKSEKVQILEDSGYNYEKEKKTTEKRIKELIGAIKKKEEEDWCNIQITRIANKPSLHHFTLIKLKNEKNLKLSDWTNLWMATYQSAFSIELFKIFENNIQTKENQKFALSFILNTIESTTSYFGEEFIKYDTVKLCKKILEINPSLENKIFEVIKKVYEHSIDKFLYIKRRRDNTWEREKATELLKEIYKKTRNIKLKSNIVDYIVANFNIVKDDGKFWHYTPPSAFKILGNYVSAKPEERIPWFTKKCIEQFDKFYKTFGKKLEFNGWEHMGGGISQAGSSFLVADRHFVTQVLTPSLKKIYDKDRKKGLSFILKKCLSTTSVTKNKPDFLNRAVLPILLSEYKNGKSSKEIFKILKTFIKMRKGIPWKNDLIFQAINNDQYTDKQKWQLVKVSLDEFNNLPINVFVEQIVFNIASKPSSKFVEKAGDVVTSWIKNPKYNTHHMIGSYGPTDGILKLLENNFDSGVNFLKNYLSTKDFIKKTDTFDTYDVAKAITKVINTDFDQGLDILESIYSYKKLSPNQQICICSGIYNIDQSNKKTLLKIYKKFLWPKLSDLLGKKINNLKNLTNKDIKPIEKKFSHSSARESIVEFGEKLANNKNFEEALNIVRIFIHDSNPPTDGSCERQQALVEGNDSYAIGTVRGRCAWVLQKFANLHGRKHIKEVVGWVKKLSKDNNFYIRLEACVPLVELIKIRHTHPPEKEERFIPENLASEIENIALNMLFQLDNQKIKGLVEYLTMVFSYHRTMGTTQACKVLKVFLKNPSDKSKEQVVPLIIFYSLFRKNAFKNWPKSWKKPKKFDDKPFKKLLKNQLENGPSTIKTSLAWQFKKLPDEIKNTPEEKRSLSILEAVILSANYLSVLTDNYDQKIFSNIYRFIEEYIENYFDLCFKLWIECIETEFKYFKNNWSEEKLHEMYWWPFLYNGKILVAILNNKGVKEFLTWFEKLAKYPNNASIANDLDTAIEKLIELKKHKKRIIDLFDLLIKRNPKYYNSKQKWLKKKRD